MELKLTLDSKIIDSILTDAFEYYYGNFQLLYVYHIPGQTLDSWYLPKIESSDWIPQDLCWAFLLEDKETGEKHILTEPYLREGLKLYIEWKLEQQEAILYTGCSDWDCVEADIVLQFALLGEIVYG